MDSNLPVSKLPRFVRTSKPMAENIPPLNITEVKPSFIARPLTASSNVNMMTPRPISSVSMSNDIKPLPKNKIENYAIGKQLGQGAYATVRLATQKRTKDIVAIKIYEKCKLTDTRKKTGLKREIHILKLLDHPHTLKLYDVLDTSKTINLITECIGGPSLHSYIKKQSDRKLKDQEAKSIFKQIVQAVAYCHSLNIVHRDLKLENIMLDKDKNVKLIDFGFSTISGKGQMCKIFCGTPSYMAPEIVKNVDYVGQYADVWALGVLLFAVLTGNFPFKGTSDRELFRKIESCKFVIPDTVDLNAQNVIKRILHKAPMERPSCEDLLKETWFQE